MTTIEGAVPGTPVANAWRRLSLWLLPFALACHAPHDEPRATGPVHLTILATTDLHGALEQVDIDRESRRPVGGVAALVAAIERERAANPAGTILLDAGDVYQGTALSNLTQGTAIVDVLDHARYDAVAVGNHEFDWGIQVMEARMAQSDFPWLIANVRERATGRPPPWARSHVVLERKGVRVAVIGLITENTPSVTLPSVVAPYEFLDGAECANALIQELLPHSADLAIVLCHVGARNGRDGLPEGDLVTLSQRIEGESAIVGGHTHQVVSALVGGVPLVEAGSSARNLARIDLEFSPAAGVVPLEPRVMTIFADEDVPDTVTAGLVAKRRAEVAPILDEVLGHAPAPIEAARAECGMGNLIADVMRAASEADLAFQNPGGVRAGLDAGEIRYGQVYRVMPFDNRIVCLELTGAEVLELLEQASAHDSFLHVSGMHYGIDFARPSGQRVVFASAGGGDPLDARRTYRVAVNDFMAQGGDSLPVITSRAGTVDTGVLIRDALAEHLRATSAAGLAIESRVEGRIELRGRS
jgi:2',3'-cyclic-nucleotide 2'-phosphodiesterase/3'-nucleotidase